MAATAIESIITKTITITAADVEAVPTSEVGQLNGVASLNASGQLPEAQLPSSVVSGSLTGGIAAWKAKTAYAINHLAQIDGIAIICKEAHTSGESWAGLGTHWEAVAAVNQMPEFYGAQGDGVTDDTAAFQAAGKAVSDAGGTVYIASKTYIVDGLIWETGVRWEGANSRSLGGTVLKAKAGSSNPGQIMLAKGIVERCGWKHVTLEGAGNAEQDGFYLYAQEPEGGGSGGLWEASFEDVQVGTKAKPFLRNSMWFRAGTIGGELPHQFITFKNVTTKHPTSGATALAARGLKFSGQCAKFEFDTACIDEGTESVAVGTNIELTREFLLGTTLSAEVPSGQTVIHLTTAPSGLEVGKVISIGEGAFNELAEVETIGGTEITLKAKTTFSHAASTNVYLLSGTVAEPATRAPREFIWRGGARQCADLQVMVDSACAITFLGTDFEIQSRTMRVRNGGLSVNIKGAHMSGSSEGTSNGHGTLKVGSNIITGATGAWAEGNLIAGPGVPFGATVTKVEGTTLTISTAVEANGLTGSETVNLTKGGRGEGYIALYEGKSTGSVDALLEGAVDRTVVNRESGARFHDLSRGSTTTVRTSEGLTLALKTAATLTIYSARDVALTDAAQTITTLSGYHTVGESVTCRATVNGTKLATGGNLTIAAGTLTLEAGDMATFLRTDYGATAWILVAVARATEVTNPVLTNGLVYPMQCGAPIPQTTKAIGKANEALVARTVPAPRNGHLKDLYVFVGSVVSAGEKVRAAIFDCGEAHAGRYTVLWESEEVAIEEAQKETKVLVGKPELAVAENQQLLVALMTNSTTGTFGVTNSTAFPQWYVLPEGWFPSPGITTPKLVGKATYGAFSFGGVGTQLTEGEVAASSNVPGLIGHVA